MSYSFSITANTKDEAGVKVEEQLAAVVLAQPNHIVDRQAAQDAAEAFIDVLAEPSETEQIVVHVNGSVSWRNAGAGADACYIGANLSINASLTAKA